MIYVIVNGNRAEMLETICQMFYAVAIGFLLAAVLYAGKSLIPCIITHSMLNAFSSFSNEAVIDRYQIQISVILCVVSCVCASIIFKGEKQKKEV